jgi:hypothetical protein
VLLLLLLLRLRRRCLVTGVVVEMWKRDSIFVHFILL